MKRYRVQVIEISEVIKPMKRWLQVASPEIANKTGVKEYDYVESNLPDSTEEKVYEQVIETLDLYAVIQAVNGKLKP